jgi:hypothetical protein
VAVVFNSNSNRTINAREWHKSSNSKFQTPKGKIMNEIESKETAGANQHDGMDVLEQSKEFIDSLDKDNINYEDFKQDSYFAVMSRLIQYMRDESTSFKHIHAMWKQAMRERITHEEYHAKEHGWDMPRWDDDRSQKAIAMQAKAGGNEKCE